MPPSLGLENTKIPRISDADVRSVKCFLMYVIGQNLRKMEGNTTVDSARDLNELQNADWVSASL